MPSIGQHRTALDSIAQLLPSIRTVTAQEKEWRSENTLKATGAMINTVQEKQGLNESIKLVGQSLIKPDEVI